MMSRCCWLLDSDGYFFDRVEQRRNKRLFLFSIQHFTHTMAEPYDPYIPNATTGNSSKQPQETAKTARVQQQVDEVVGIMQENIDKVMQRGERLDDLRGKTEDLQATAGHFKRGANQVRKRMWWKDLKWKIIIAVTILVILGVIIGSIVGTQTHNNN